MSHKQSKRRRRQIMIRLRAQDRLPDLPTRAERRRAIAAGINRRGMNYRCGRCGEQKFVRMDATFPVFGGKPVCPECARKLVTA